SGPAKEAAEQSLRGAAGKVLRAMLAEGGTEGLQEQPQIAAEVLSGAGAAPTPGQWLGRTGGSAAVGSVLGGGAGVVDAAVNAGAEEAPTPPPAAPSPAMGPEFNPAATERGGFAVGETVNWVSQGMQMFPEPLPIQRFARGPDGRDYA